LKGFSLGASGGDASSQNWPCRRSNKIDRHFEGNGPFAANRARAALSALYGWAIGEGLVYQNPVVGTRKATEEIPRDRILSEEELRLIWQLAGDGEYGAIIRLLILTGQRGEEVGGMLWSELRLQGGLWSISAERTKNGKPHEVAVSTLALEILNAQSKREDRDLVFGAREGAFQGWSKAKEALDHVESLGQRARDHTRGQPFAHRDRADALGDSVRRSVLAGVVIYLFFATAIGIFLATIARTMPQLGLLYLLVATPMNILSGSNTPLESMPRLLQIVMQASPSTHFVSFAQAGAGLYVVWPEFLAVALMGSLFFSLAVFRFRGVSAQTT
jgi:ABC-2 type transporter/Phage integrase family